MDVNALLHSDPERLLRIAALNLLQHRGALAVDDDIETLGCVVRLRGHADTSACVLIGSEDEGSLLWDAFGAKAS